MQRLVDAELPICFATLAYTEALELFERNKQEDTKSLLEGRSDPVVKVNRCSYGAVDDFTDLYIEPLLWRSGLLHSFGLSLYREGFLLRFPAIGESELGEIENQEKLSDVYDEYERWGRIMAVSHVGSLNRLVSQRRIKEHIRIEEAYQMKKLSDIAGQVAAKQARVVLIAGPSSSGKTTTAKKLSIELKVMGLEPLSISLDDYYVGTARTPLGADGKPDFECLEALDVPLLNKQLLDLFQGKEVVLPSFDFKSGSRREEGGAHIHLNERSVLVIEGIHGLNDALTSLIDQSQKFKVYVSALTALTLDNHNRIPTSDNRLIRRMVRDNQFRGAGAATTIRMWPNVQAGARQHIFPYQESADVCFNSALAYELGALKYYAEPLLRSVKPAEREYAEARRLLAFLGNFSPIPPQYVPGASILREFIGESEFKY
jgi:uridine kinase